MPNRVDLADVSEIPGGNVPIAKRDSGRKPFLSWKGQNPSNYLGKHKNTSECVQGQVVVYFPSSVSEPEPSEVEHPGNEF